MELLQLKYFKTVAEIGKIAEAAQALFVTAPALSTSISRLEKELGVKLFDRTNNRITLNRQGRILLRTVNQIFSQLDCAKAELRQSVLRQGPHLSLASVSSTPLVDMVAAFSKAYPDFTLEWTSIHRAALANSGLSTQYDFLLAAESDVPEFFFDELESQVLFRDEPVVMLHPDHPLAGHETISLSMLQKEKIFLPFQDFPLHDHLIRMFENANLPFPAGNAYSHLATQKLVAEGLGISFSTRHSGKTPGLILRYVPLEDLYSSWVYRLFWRKGHRFTEDEQQFKTFLEQYYQAL